MYLQVISGAVPSGHSSRHILPPANLVSYPYMLVFWYSKKPIGHKVLSLTVGRLCRLAGIEGYYTNHPLCTTITTRLYQSGIDEQLVMERTGHSERNEELQKQSR